jgi:predicted outer membrane lipoprotein
MLAYILFVSFRLPMRMLAALAFGIIVCFKLELCEMDNNTLKMVLASLYCEGFRDGLFSCHAWRNDDDDDD